MPKGRYPILSIEGSGVVKQASTVQLGVPTAAAVDPWTQAIDTLAVYQAAVAADAAAKNPSKHDGVRQGPNLRIVCHREGRSSTDDLPLRRNPPLAVNAAGQLGSKQCKKMVTHFEETFDQFRDAFS
jgi:hypothetical protein